MIMAHAKKDPARVLTHLSNGFLGSMLSVFLLYPGFGGYELITKYKAGLFFLLTGGYVLLMVLLRLELSLIGNYPWPDLHKVWNETGLAEKCIAGYWCMTAISTALSENRSIAFWGEARYEGFITLSLYCLSFLLLIRYAKPKAWMLWVFSGAVSLNCILALIQIAGYNPFSLYPQGMDYHDAFKLYSGQFLGTIGNVDFLSALFSLAIPIFWITIVKGKGKTRLLLLIPLCLSMAVLLIAFVAGGVLGVFSGALLCVPVIMKRGRGRKITACVVAVLIVLGLFVVYVAGDKIGGFVYEASQIMHGNLDDSFGSGRIYIWRKSLELVDGHLLFGGGPETMGLRTDAYFERYDEDLGVLIQSFVDTAHNEYLNILVNQGLLALLFFMGALIVSAIQWGKLAPDNPGVAVCGGAVLCYCIQAFFGISSLITAPFFWITLAILVICIKPKGKIIDNGGKMK